FLRVFTIATLVKPLPPVMTYNVSHNLSFFTSIFTQFFDEKGIANAQKSLGLGQEEKVCNVRLVNPCAARKKGKLVEFLS
ncbi:hypothetical protein IFM89_016446, partial [Coptis chinensis]